MGLFQLMLLCKLQPTICKNAVGLEAHSNLFIMDATLHIYCVGKYMVLLLILLFSNPPYYIEPLEATTAATSETTFESVSIVITAVAVISIGLNLAFIVAGVRVYCKNKKSGKNVQSLIHIGHHHK